jgi:hypothetical protein
MMLLLWCQKRKRRCTQGLPHCAHGLNLYEGRAVEEEEMFGKVNIPEL